MKKLSIALIVAVAVLAIPAAALAQGVLFVKDNKVGIGTDTPGPAILHLKATGGPASFLVETAGATVNTNWYFQSNATTGAFLISNLFGGAAQFQVFPNVGGSNPPSTFVVRDGGVGIGTQSPGFNKFNVAPGKTTIADAWTVRSSARFKENIETFPAAIETVQKLRGVSYDLKESGEHTIGLIAEEVAEVLPEIVSLDEFDNPLALDYDKLAAVLIEAVKAQQAQIDALQKQLQGN